MGRADSLSYDYRRSKIFDTSSRLVHDPKFRLSHEDDHESASLLKDLPEHSILLVGEEHNHPMHHSAEFQLLRALRAHTPQALPVTLGLEMFYNIKDHRQALEDFVFGSDSLADLKRRTEWETMWGWPMRHYAKLLNFAKANQIRVVGLNAPERVSGFVKRNGIEGLLGKPRFPEVDLGNQEHLERFVTGPLAEVTFPDVASVAGSARSGGEAALPPELRRVYQEQVLREEWMASAVASHARDIGGRFMAVVGRAHIAGRCGVPDRIHRRLADEAGGRRWEPPLTVLMQGATWDKRGHSTNPIVDALPGPTEADWVWYTEHKKGCPIGA